MLHIVRKSKFEMGENKFHTQMGISKIGEKGYSKNAVSWNHLFNK